MKEREGEGNEGEEGPFMLFFLLSPFPVRNFAPIGSVPSLPLFFFVLLQPMNAQH